MSETREEVTLNGCVYRFDVEADDWTSDDWIGCSTVRSIDFRMAMCEIARLRRELAAARGDAEWIECHAPQGVVIDCTDDGSLRVTVGTRDDGPALRLGFGPTVWDAIAAARQEGGR